MEVKKEADIKYEEREQQFTKQFEDLKLEQLQKNKQIEGQRGSLQPNEQF